MLARIPSLSQTEPPPARTYTHTHTYYCAIKKRTPISEEHHQKVNYSAGGHSAPSLTSHFLLSLLPPPTRLFTVPPLLLVCPSASGEASQSDLLVQKHQRSDLQLGPRRERGDAHQHAVRAQVQTQVHPHCYNNILSNIRLPFKKILLSHRL